MSKCLVVVTDNRTYKIDQPSHEVLVYENYLSRKGETH